MHNFTNVKNLNRVFAATAASSGDCQDQNPAECQKKQYLCSNPQYLRIMKKTCAKTCNLCSSAGGDSSGGILSKIILKKSLTNSLKKIKSIEKSN